MKGRYVSIVLGTLGGLALVAAACAPAAQPAPTTTTTQAQTTTTTTEQKASTTTTQPKQETKVEPKTAAKPATTTTTTTTTTAAKKEAPKPTTSVSGIPLPAGAKFGGTLRNGRTSVGPTFNPWEERSGGPGPVVDPVSNMVVQNQVWLEGPVDEHVSKALFFNLRPDLAKSWEQSADGLRWTFKFRDGVKWSDGTPFTCADAAWSLDTIRTGQGLRRSPAATHFLAIDQIQCTDDLNMVITMKRPKASLLQMIGLPYNQVRPKHIYEKNLDKMRNEPPTVGTGPFVLGEYFPAEKVTLTRKKDYWDQPFPYLDGIELQILSNQAQDAGLRAGRLDFGTTSGLAGSRLKQMREGCAKCVFYKPIVNPSVNDAVMVHHQRPPWNDPVIKDVLSLALDRKKLNQLVYLGDAALPYGGYFVPGAGWEMPYERVKQVPGWNLDTPEENKQRARELLAQAGYKPGELKLIVTFWAVIGYDAPPMIEDLQAVGIDATPELLETARAYDAWTAGDFDVGVHGFWLTTSEPDEMLYEHFYTGSDRNYNRYSNPEVDRLIDQMSITVDPELRKQRAWDVAEIVMREQGKIQMNFDVYVPVHGPDVRNYGPASGWIGIAGAGVRWQSLWLDR